MTHRHYFRLGASSPNLTALTEQLYRLEPWALGPPEKFSIDDKKAKFVSFTAAIQRARRNVWAEWRADTPTNTWVSWRPTVLKAGRLSMPFNVSLAFDLLRTLDFEWASTPSCCDTWGYAGAPVPTALRGFSDGHWVDGWLCAFKGQGHRRLVSRRWLDYGPWRVLRDPESDLSVVQFHDLNADDETALAQAQPGHELMGISETGGFIQSEFVWRYQQGASYDPLTQTLIYVVNNRNVSPREFLEAAAVKFWQPLTSPVKQVAYVFIDEKAARQHLHQAWLRELQVRTFVNGVEVDLTATYEPPPPEVPDWVRRLQDREGR